MWWVEKHVADITISHSVTRGRAADRAGGLAGWLVAAGLTQLARQDYDMLYRR